MNKNLILILFLTYFIGIADAQTDYRNKEVADIMADLLNSSKFVDSNFCNEVYTNGIRMVECSFSGYSF